MSKKRVVDTYTFEKTNMLSSYIVPALGAGFIY